MNTIVNAWGIDGTLSMTAFISAACMGMLSDCDKIVVRNLYFNSENDNDIRFKRIQSAYTNYYSKIYGRENNIIFAEEVTLDGVLAIGNNISSTLLEKFGKENEALLSLGCSEDDMNRSIENGIYDNSRLGEAYFSSLNDLEYLYTDNVTLNALGNETMIINCGDYSCDGTAAAFIPLENRIPVTGITRAVNAKIHRYNVLSGPSVKSSQKVRIRHPEVFGDDTPEEIELFDIPMFAEKIRRSVLFASEEERKLMRQDIVNLEIQYARIRSKEHDYRGYDPNSYPEKFVETILCGGGDVSATFINLKTNGTDILPLDITSTDFTSKIYQKKVNIVNFLNALSIVEIENNFENYRNGGIYSFGSDLGSTFNAFNLFDIINRRKILQFLLSTLMIRLYLYNCFNSNANSNLKLSDDVTCNFPENLEFFETVKRIINEVCSNYFYPVINILKEIDVSSEQADIISDDVYSCLYYAQGKKNKWRAEENKYGELNSFVRYIIKETIGKSFGLFENEIDSYNVAVNSLFTNIDSALKKYNNEESAADYAWKLIKSVVKNSEEFAKMVIIW